MNDIYNPAFWEKRLEEAPAASPHHAVFKCPNDLWDRIGIAHASVLVKYIGRSDSVLDLGCGWGRLFDLMPTLWGGSYTGLDLSPDFVAVARVARLNHKNTTFVCGTFQDVLPTFEPKQFDWGVCVSIRGMIVRERGREEWDKLQEQMLRVCLKLLILEYDPDDTEGTVIQ